MLKSFRNKKEGRKVGRWEGRKIKREERERKGKKEKLDIKGI